MKVWHDDFEVWVDPPAITVDVSDPKVVGTILGPDGRPLHTVLAPRPPFGFRSARCR